MENIETKIKYISTLLSKIKNINQQIEFIFLESNKYPLIINEKINAIENALYQLKTVTDTDDPMYIGNVIGICDLKIAELYKIFSSVDLMASSSVSHSFIIDTLKNIKSFDQIWTSYTANPINNEINKYITDKLVLMEPQTVEKSYQSNPSAVSLYATYIQRMFDETNQSEHQQFYDMLERAKTMSIVGDKYMAAPSPNKKVPPLQRYGVIPVRQHLTINELMQLYLGKGCTTDECDISSFIKMMGAAGNNVLVVYNITSYPIEFNIWKLINTTDANGYIFPDSAGINRKIMQRTATISEVGAGVNENEYGYTAKEYETKAGANWVIVRTINGTHWDALSNELMAVSKDTYRFDKLTVSESVVKKILRGPSPRIDVYNKQKNDAFAQSLNHRINVDDETKVDNKALIDTLIHRITNRIISYVDKSLLPLPTNQQKLEEAIMDPNFIELANIEMLRTYAECGTDPDLPVHELVGSFISDVDIAIIVQFARNLKMNMIDMGPKEKIFKEYSGDVLKTRLYNIFVEIIKKSVSSTIRSKENIYEKLMIKNNILKVMY